jgi:4-phytase / acid phosphatase
LTSSVRIFAVLAILLLCGLRAPAQVPSDTPVYTIILTRHGVRAPTWTPERLNAYSAAPWPDFGVPPGYLTPRGFDLMKIMGAYDREAYVAAADKAACSKTYFWADTDQRTLESARALTEGMLPGCKVDVHSLGEGKKDPLFDPQDAGLFQQDAKLGLAAVSGRIGANLKVLVDSNRAAFDELDQILRGGSKAATSLFAQPVSLAAGEDGVAMTGPLNLASTFTENLLLEYANGMSGAQFGWGRLDAAKLQRIMTLHTQYADLVRRTPYLARMRGSILLNRIVRSMEQAVARKPVKGALGTPETTMLVISGHDTNISNLSGMLQLSWLLPSYQRDDVPPGGALVFSLWRSANRNRYSVRLEFVSATMDQMHNATPLTDSNPPAKADLFVPACSAAEPGYACEWSAFARSASSAILPGFVQ